MVWILYFFVAGFQRIFVSLESESNFIKSLLPEIIYNKVFVPVFLVWVENSTFKSFCFFPENEMAKLTNEHCRGREATGAPDHGCHHLADSVRASRCSVRESTMAPHRDAM